MRLLELGSSISDNQFILQILNNMTDDYDLKLAMMEKRVTDKSNPLTVNKIHDDLNLRFERLTEKRLKRVKMTMIRSLSVLLAYSKDNINIAVQSGIKRKILQQKFIEMAIRTAKITKNSEKIYLLHLLSLIRTY
jgi:hypothetical protein